MHSILKSPGGKHSTQALEINSHHRVLTNTSSKITEDPLNQTALMCAKSLHNSHKIFLGENIIPTLLS